jgi:5'-3' exonuclease
MPVYGQAGLESDDLLAIAAIQLAQQKQRGVMITSDGDLYQCINECVSWYDPMKDSLLNPQSFEKLKGVPPWEWGNVKAIGGCSTDNVAGLEGVGEKGAIQFLRNEMPSHYKKYSTIVKSWDSLEIEKWDALVMLPHKKTKPIRLREPDYKPEVFFDFCKEYDIDSYLEGRGRRRWEDFFEGRFNGAPRSRRRK